MHIVMKSLVIVLYGLLAAHCVLKLRKLKPMPVADALGEVGRLSGLEWVFIILAGMIVVFMSLVTLAASWQTALFTWSVSATLAVLLLRTLLWRVQWGLDRIAYRDGNGRLHTCAWEDVLGGERTWMHRGKVDARVTIVHTRTFSLVVDEKRGATFLAELTSRSGELRPVRPRRGPWHGRVQDVEQYERDNWSSLGLGIALMASAAELPWMMLLGAIAVAWSILRRCLSEKEQVPHWLVRILFAGGNYWF